MAMIYWAMKIWGFNLKKIFWILVVTNFRNMELKFPLRNFDIFYTRFIIEALWINISDLPYPPDATGYIALVIVVNNTSRSVEIGQNVSYNTSYDLGYHESLCR